MVSHTPSTSCNEAYRTWSGRRYYDAEVPLKASEGQPSLTYAFDFLYFNPTGFSPAVLHVYHTWSTPSTLITGFSGQAEAYRQQSQVNIDRNRRCRTESFRWIYCPHVKIKQKCVSFCIYTIHNFGGCKLYIKETRHRELRDVAVSVRRKHFNHKLIARFTSGDTSIAAIMLVSNNVDRTLLPPITGN